MSDLAQAIKEWKAGPQHLATMDHQPMITALIEEVESRQRSIEFRDRQLAAKESLILDLAEEVKALKGR